MKKSKNIRLQGKEWFQVKKDLVLVRMYVNKNNHYKGYYKPKNNLNQNFCYTHYLCDQEIVEFNQNPTVNPIYLK